MYFSDEEKFAKNELCGGTKSETSAIFTQMDEKNKNSEISDKKFRKILQNFSEQKKDKITKQTDVLLAVCLHNLLGLPKSSIKHLS